MDKDAENTDKAGKPKTVAGYIASALDMEERLSMGVYRDYLDPKNWPADLEPEAFNTIEGYLTILLKDTEKHKKMLSDLNKLYGENTQ